MYVYTIILKIILTAKVGWYFSKNELMLGPGLLSLIFGYILTSHEVRKYIQVRKYLLILEWTGTS